MTNNRKHSPKEIIERLSEAEALLASGCTVGKVCAAMGITKQTFYRWRKAYSGLKVDQAQRLKALERENVRLRKAVADLTLDNVVLKEAIEKNK